MTSVRIKLASIDIDQLNALCSTIRDIASKSGIVVRGPIPMPTRRLRITTRKSPCGNGKATFDRWEMRIHKRVIDMPMDERVLHNIMRVPIPREINIEIEMLE
jgi:small subunit ribosomal protein S10